MIKKITIGFVVQDYTESGEPVCQEFIAGDQVEWEDDNGNKITPPTFPYMPYDMRQPETSEDDPVS